jgi:hypothetical protein
MKTKRQQHVDRRGRRWTVSVVPRTSAEEADFEFWWKLGPEARVNAVFDATESALKAQGRRRVPRLRRIARRIELRGR